MRPVKGGVIQAPYDFQALDQLTPHPIYGWMSWVSILNPSHATWKDLESLLKASYNLCIDKYRKKNVKFFHKQNCERSCQSLRFIGSSIHPKGLHKKTYSINTMSSSK